MYFLAFNNEQESLSTRLLCMSENLTLLFGWDVTGGRHRVATQTRAMAICPQTTMLES
jgi:hypothetical protein